MKLLSLVLLTALTTTLQGVAQEAPIPVDTARTAAADLKRVTGSNEFKAALDIIADNGETLDVNSARTLTSRQAAGRREVVFNIAGTAGRPPEFSHLVYLERPGEAPLVYFEGPTVTERPPTAAPKTQSNSASLLGCLFKPWGPWQVIRTFCGYRYWCFFKGQQAIYLEETRQRQCPNGVQVERRTVLVHCGC